VVAPDLTGYASRDWLVRFLANPAISLETRVRMAASIGVVMMGLMGADAGGMYGEDVTAEDVAVYVRRAAHDVFPAG